jgi:hypothetical protein
MLATMAYTMDILGLHPSLVVRLASCLMESCCRTGERPEMEDVKADHYTRVAVLVDDSDSQIARIE